MPTAHDVLTSFRRVPAEAPPDRPIRPAERMLVLLSDPRVRVDELFDHMGVPPSVFRRILRGRRLRARLAVVAEAARVKMAQHLALEAPGYLHDLPKLGERFTRSDTSRLACERLVEMTGRLDEALAVPPQRRRRKPAPRSESPSTEPAAEQAPGRVGPPEPVARAAI